MRRLLSQMIRRPADAIASSVEMLGQQLPGGQLLDGVVSRFVYAFSRPSHEGFERGRGERTVPPAQSDSAAYASPPRGTDGGVFDSNVAGTASGGINDLPRNAPHATTEPPASVAAPDVAKRVRVKEAEMDRDLRDDMLKLVRYKVLFVKREYEHAFPEQEDLVSENMDGAAFTAWKVAEFIQMLGRGEMRVPHKWAEKGYPGGGHVRDGLLLGLRDSDKKYLRVYYEVMDRYPREKFKYEEQQIRVLEQIRDEIHECDDK